jgi:type I restriction enzyme S subunit
MKHNWTYKKLGEVATINYGTRVVQKRDGGTIYPVYGGGDATFRMDTYNRENCLVVARFAMSPKCTRRVVGKFFLNDSGLTLEAKEGVCQDYLDWHIIALNDEIYRTAKGAAQKNLDVKTFTSLSIGVPSLDEQQAIVRELDGINRSIDLQEEQLREYDRLAQSLFYTTFGDPTTNPKGWSLAEFSTLCDNLTKGPFGSDIKKSLFVPKSKDTYKVYIQANAIQKDISLGDYYISKEYFEEKMRRFELHSGDYIITCDGTLGKFIRMTPNMERGIISASLLKLTLNELITSSYFESIWNNYLLDKLVHQTRNAALVHLPSATNIGKELIPLPPLALQQSFAAQIEAIEQQKALIRKSLDDTRTLLAARMQYYFE